MTEPDILSPDALREIQKRHEESRKRNIESGHVPVSQTFMDVGKLLAHIAALSRPTVAGGEGAAFEAFSVLTNLLIEAGVFQVEREGGPEEAWTNIISAVKRLKRPTAAAHVSEDVLPLLNQAQAYMDGFDNKCELRVGPYMLRAMVEELTNALRRVAALNGGG